MRFRYLALTTALLIAPILTASAATPDPASVQAPIAGQDALADRGRGGPDGSAWAPVTRSQSPAGVAPAETAAKVSAQTNAKNDPGTHLSPGQDPGTPAATDANGPGIADAPAPLRRP